MFRSFGLALIGLLHPRIIWLTFRPFILLSLLWGILFYFIWEKSIAIMSDLITNSFITSWLADLMTTAGWEELRAVVAPLLFVGLLIPIITISLLIFIAFTSVPGVVKHLSKQKNYLSMYEANGGGLIGSIGYSFISILICLVLLLLTLPFWWMPPMVAIIPPLLWGWLTMRLMTYDVLAQHASAEERALLISKHKWTLLTMGVISGLMGAVPTFFWATSAFALVFFPIVSFFALWVYSMVFIFSTLWFAHYLLEELRLERLNGVIDVS